MTGYLLDTSIVSELILPKPDPFVTAWMRSQSPDSLYLSTMTIGELMRGASKLGETKRGKKLYRWISQDLVAQYKNRILAFDQPAALLWGTIMGEHDTKGTKLPAADAQIAAIAMTNKLKVVSRNVKDFERMLEIVINPFEPASGI